MKKHTHSVKGIERRLTTAAAVVALAGLALAGCAHQTAPAPKAASVAATAPSSVAPAPIMSANTVATVNGVPIERAQENALLQQSGQPVSPAQRATIEQGLIVRELIRQAAEAEKLGNADEVRAAADKARVDAENRLYVARHAVPRVVTEEQVRARYDAIAATLGLVTYKPRVIVLPSDAAARAVLAKLAHRESFNAIASRESIGPSKADGGALPWVTFKTPVSDGQTQGLPVEVARELTRLRPGEYSKKAVAVGQTRVVVKLDAAHPTLAPTYEQARGALRQSLQEQAREDAFNALVSSLEKRAVIMHRQ
ncbi:peptidyl-prolyl cis-trans isomerase [Burkholderia ubonensis]|uniref:peptidylprolyl isomerase n=1 Tax=Burkholderia ubonensis TaxID=101571 RepID=UPI0012F7D1E9|nr:peptidylprolyl isomerase [Burkholderia ubonensis]